MRIAFIITQNMLATSLTNAYELFYAANQVIKRDSSTTLSKAELIKVSIQTEPVTLPSGLSFTADAVIGKEIFDMVYIPALWRNPRPVVNNNPALVSWIRRQYEHGAIINSTGTGVCFIAEAGLLNNKPATTHWHHFEQFARDYPSAQLKRQHFITNAGKIYCAASVNALTDLTLHHVHRFYSKQISEHLTQHFSHEVRQPFDRLSFTQEENTNHPDETVLQAQLWMQNNLSNAAITIEQVAELFGMSQRNFTRRFRKATNTNPIKYLKNQRLNESKELLQNSNLSINEIAYRVGYIDASYFTKIFKESFLTTPKQYQTRVRAKLFSSDKKTK